MLIQIKTLAENTRGPQYMEAVLAGLHQANTIRAPMTLEFSTRNQTVGLFCRVPAELKTVFTEHLQDAYPGCSLDVLPDDALETSSEMRVESVSLRLTPDVFALRTFESFEDMLQRELADPIAGLLSAIRSGRRGRLQSRIRLTIRPAGRSRTRHARRVASRLSRRFPLEILHTWFSDYCTSDRVYERWFAGLLGWSSRPAGMAIAERMQKLDEHLFDVDLLLSVAAPPDAEAKAREKLRQLIGSFGRFTSQQTAFTFRHLRGSPSLRRRGFLLSSAELATLWHPTMQTATVARLGTETFVGLEPPVILPSKGKESAVTTLGRVRYRNNRDRFGVRLDDRRRHLYVAGKTGMGKTTLLKNMIAEDLAGNRGVAVIDPHGDLANDVLTLVPSHRTNDVILIDPADSTHVAAFNPLHVPPGGDGGLVADGVLAAFQKVFGFDDGQAPRLSHIFRNCLLTLVEAPDTSLVAVQRILRDTNFRRTLVARVDNPAVRDFWTNEFERWKPGDRTAFVASLQNKLGAFLSNRRLQMILGQGRGRIDIRQAMDDGRILIVNLSKGTMGENASNLLGSLIVSSLQQAAMSRAAIPEADRRDFFAYVDEFQNFATESFATILSEARKYRLSLTLANQYLDQVDEETLHAVVGNVGSMLVFQVGAKDAEFFAEQLGGGVTPAGLMNLPKYTAFIRLLVDGMPQRPFSMTTLTARAIHEAKANAIRATMRKVSRDRYSRSLKQVEQEIQQAYSL